jgi:hypothetical protein
MEKFLDAAAIAWNPIGEIRRRIRSRTLTVASVLVPSISAVIACQLLLVGAQDFYSEMVISPLLGGELPKHPLMTSEYAQRFMSAISALVPAGAVSLLPARVFDPLGRHATIATMLVVAAAWAFYSAAIGVPVYFVSAALATVSMELGLRAMMVLSILSALAQVGLALFFWFRIALSVLRLKASQVTTISVVALSATALLVGFFAFIVAAWSPPLLQR